MGGEENLWVQSNYYFLLLLFLSNNRNIAFALYSNFRLEVPEMKEEEDIVIFDYGLPSTRAGFSKLRKMVPTADSLFRNIENEIEAIKEIKEKLNENTVHDKIKRALERKLGNTKLIRGLSAKDETQMKEMIETCRQRKHYRQIKQFTRPQTVRNRVASARDRRTSVKNSERKIQSQKPRPKTSRPARAATLQPRQPQFMHFTEVFHKNSAKQQECRKKGQEKLKKKNHHHRNFSKFSDAEKQNILYESSTSKQINRPPGMPESQHQKYFAGVAADFAHMGNSDYARKMKSKNLVKIKNKFHNILEKCKSEQQDIICLGKKIGHFQYFCQKINSKKSNIQRFCERAQKLKKELDESF